jgi:hypothetical protein
MNPYAAPGAASPASTEATEEDIAAAAPPLLAKAAGGVVALAGAVVGLTGMQTFMIVNLRGPFAVAPYVLAVLGAAHLVVAAVVFRARVWGALVAMGGTLLMALLSGVWLVFSVSHGLVSLYALGAPFVAGAAVVFSLLALGPCQRASAARARLKAQGMNLGI